MRMLSKSPLKSGLFYMIYSNYHYARDTRRQHSQVQHLFGIAFMLGNIVQTTQLIYRHLLFGILLACIALPVVGMYALVSRKR